MAAPVDWNKVSSLTPGMKNLGNQFNRRFLSRDGTSDGAWGDSAHQTHASGHNPDDTSGSKPSWEDADKVPDIRSIDVDNNLNDSEVNMQDVIDHTRKLPNLKSVIRYMIYDHYMYHQDDNFNPTPYTGSSPHTEHAHFEGAHTESGDQNTTFDFKFDELGDFVDQPTFNKWLDEYFKSSSRVLQDTKGFDYNWLAKLVMDYQDIPWPLGNDNEPEKGSLWQILNTIQNDLKKKNDINAEILGKLTEIIELLEADESNV